MTNNLEEGGEGNDDDEQSLSVGNRRRRDDEDYADRSLRHRRDRSFLSDLALSFSSLRVCEEAYSEFREHRAQEYGSKEMRRGFNPPRWWLFKPILYSEAS